jgi:hypothetical protein
MHASTTIDHATQHGKPVDESREVNVGLLETFNWLTGLTVEHIAAPRRFLLNGANNLENLKAPDDTWKVRLVEEGFYRLMFGEGG